jgi:glycosyltransferase involved in cell wall biosynthesis
MFYESLSRIVSGMRKLNILIIYESGQGGAETHVLRLFQTLHILGHNVAVEHLSPMPSEDITISLLLTLLKDFILVPYSIMKITKLVNKTGIDLVHVHSERIPLILGYFIHKIKKIPLIITIHSSFSRALRLNKLYKSTNKIIAVSPEIKWRLISYGVDGSKIIVIPNMVDMGQYHLCRNTRRTHTSYTIVHISRLDTSKIDTVKILLEATPMIFQEFPNAQIVIVGNGPKFLEISKLAQHVNEILSKNVVVITGYVENVDDIVKSSTVIIGVGRVAMEAMAHGKPVIVASASKNGVVTGGIVTKENVEYIKKYNFTGRNYREKMDPPKMSELIVRLLRDENYRQSLGTFGRDFARKNFDAVRVTKKIETVYVECLK